MLKKIKIEIVMIYDDEITPDPSGWDWFDLLDLNSEIITDLNFSEQTVFDFDKAIFKNANADL